MWKVTLTGFGLAALVGCGPDLDEQAPPARTTQALEAVKRPDTAVRLTAVELFASPEEQTLAPEAPTFLNTFIYQTPITR